MLGSTLIVGKSEDLSRLNSLLDAQGVQTSIAIGSSPTSTNLDYVLADDCYLTGIYFQTQGSTFSDTVSLQVIDTTGAFSGVAGTILGQFASNWVVGSDVSGANTVFIQATYPAKIYATMALRLVYSSTNVSGTGTVNVGANYLLHKCLY